MLARLHQETDRSTDLPDAAKMSPGKHRDYVHHTTTLTAISDEDESPPSTPPSTPTSEKSKSIEKTQEAKSTKDGTKVAADVKELETRLKALENKLQDKEKIIDELKKRVEAETTSAEDLHEKLLDSNKTLEEMEENLKSKSEEINALQKELSEKDGQISDLEAEKEKGSKDVSVSEGSNKIIEELKDRITKLEEELDTSRETNAKIKEEMTQMALEHGEAVMRMKEEMEKLHQSEIEELQNGFRIQLDEELKQQEEEMDKQAQELEIYKQTESELKQKLDEIQTEHEKQLSELREKYEDGDKTEAKQSESDGELGSTGDTLDKGSIEAALREELKAETLKEYEDSIDNLKSEYELRISELNSKLKTFETQTKVESSESEDETDIRERLRVEIAQEFKDKLQHVTDEYELRLKHLQDIVDSKEEDEKKEKEAIVKKLSSSSPPHVISRSRSLDRIPSQDKPKVPAEYEGFVSTIRREYEDRINCLQREIAQYKTSVGPVPLAPLMPLSSKPQVVSSTSSGDSTDKPKAMKAGSPTESLDSSDSGLRQQIYNELQAQFEDKYKQLKDDYESRLEELTSKLNALQSDSTTQGGLENKIREEYEQKIAQLKEEYEKIISDLKEEHTIEVEQLTADLEKSQQDKLAAEKKVKADMFVWHEETVSQLKVRRTRTVKYLLILYYGMEAFFDNKINQMLNM